MSGSLLRMDLRERNGVRVAGVLASAVVIRLAFPEPGIGWLVLPGALLLLMSLHGAPLRTGAWLGALHGIVLYGWMLTWLRVIGVDAWLLLTGVCVLWTVLLGVLLAQSSRMRLWPLWSAAAWMAVEVARSSVPLGGFSWGRLAFAEPWALTAVARWIGTTGLTGAVVLLAGLLAVAVWAVTDGEASVSRRTALASAAVLALVPMLTIPAAHLAAEVARETRDLPVAVVQGNVPRLGLDFNAQRRAVLDNHVEVTRALASAVREGTVEAPAFVIWPENASDIDPLRDATARRLIDEAAQQVGVPVVVGAVLDNGDGTLSNAGIVWKPGEGPGARYAKRHLVPFGEYVPGRAVLARLITRFDRVSRDFVPGEAPGVLDVGGRRLGAVMCFEVAYDDSMRDVGRDAALLVVQTNNATYGLSGQPLQQLAITRVRAIEHDRTVLVAATTGISGVVRTDGTMEDGERLEEFTQGFVVASVPSSPSPWPSGPTIGWLLGLASLGTSAVIALWAFAPAMAGVRATMAGRARTRGATEWEVP